MKSFSCRRIISMLDEQARTLQLVHPRFDIVDRGAQAPFEARLLVQAELPLLRDDGDEMRLVLLQ